MLVNTWGSDIYQQMGRHPERDKTNKTTQTNCYFYKSIEREKERKGEEERERRHPFRERVNDEEKDTETEGTSFQRNGHSKSKKRIYEPHGRCD